MTPTGLGSGFVNVFSVVLFVFFQCCKLIKNKLKKKIHCHIYLDGKLSQAVPASSPLHLHVTVCV